MSGLSDGQQAILMLFAFLIPALTAVSSWAALGMPTDRAAIGLLVSTVISSLVSAIIAFSKEYSGISSNSTTSSTPSSPAKTQLLIRRFSSKFKFFLSSFAMDTSARSPGRRRRRSGSYDPQPRRRGPRRGVEPAGLKRWRLAHKRRSHDPNPGYSRTLWTGPRGGHYFRGPRKNRYDPQPRRRSVRGYASRAGRGIEGALNKWGTALGLALGLGAGAYQGWNEFNDVYGPQAGQNYINTIIGGPIKNSAGTVLGTRTPEISKLWGTNDVLWAAPRNPLDFLQYKFTGNTQYNSGSSAWTLPFWVSLATWIGSTIGMKIGRLGKLHRFLRPISKIAKGATIGAVIGALALPGTELFGGTITTPGGYAQPAAYTPTTGQGGTLVATGNVPFGRGQVQTQNLMQ